MKGFSQNGMLRCYNLFPSYFSNIDAMTDYLSTLQQMGINTVWLNPIQLAGTKPMGKVDEITGVQQTVKKSIYAMWDPEMIDPRFSVVQRDKDEDAAFSLSQMTALSNDATIAKMIETSGIEKFSIVQLVPLIKASRKKYAASKLEQDKRVYETLLSIQRSCIQFLDKEAIKRFTAKAKELNITPIFDLVTNHVAKGAPITQKGAHPEWFCDDSTYPDATCFKYAELLQFSHMENEEILALIQKDPKKLEPLSRKIYENNLSEADIAIIQSSTLLSDDEKEQLQTKIKYKLSLKERREIETLIPIIVNGFWDKFISQYIDLGFSGARVDCVRKVPAELRRALYSLIKEKVKTRDGKDDHVVILEEALFSDLSPKQFRDVVKGAGGTHITASVFNSERKWDGSLVYDHSEEEYFKKQMVQNGVINFTGNHDHYSCAMKVALFLAKEKLDADPVMKRLYDTAPPDQTKGKGREIRKSIFLHSYVKDVLSKLQDPNNYWDLCMRFGKMYRDMLLSQMFQGSSGYYMLSGDEAASVKQPTVFVRENDAPLYPEYTFSFFINNDHPLYPYAQKVLEEMAIERSAESADRVIKTVASDMLVGAMAGARTGTAAAKTAVPAAKKTATSGACAAVATSLKADKSKPAGKSNPVAAHKAITADEIAKLKLAAESRKKEKLQSETEAERQARLLKEAQAREKDEERRAKAEEQQRATQRAEAEKAAVREVIREIGHPDAFKSRLLSAAKDQIMSEVNAKVTETYAAFFERLTAKCSSVKDFDIKHMQILSDKDYRRLQVQPLHKQTTTHNWERPTILNKFANVEFFKEINNIFDHLSRPKDGFWSEVFKRDNENILIVMRKNGPGFDSDTEMVIINLNPDKAFDITKEDLHKMAIWIQERKFGVRDEANPEFHKAYGGIMGNTQYKQKPAKLFFAGKLTVNDDVKNYAIEVDGKSEKFDIVVSPQPITPLPLLGPQPDEFIPEDDLVPSTEALIKQFKMLSMSCELRRSTLSSSTSAEVSERQKMVMSQ
ncbi:MAG: hypothetical protein JSR17_07050 [Proteobacteria bacterium]|nr:hypothetical protein [Pseudomonadota bacterium]